MIENFVGYDTIIMNALIYIFHGQGFIFIIIYFNSD